MNRRSGWGVFLFIVITSYNHCYVNLEIIKKQTCVIYRSVDLDLAVSELISPGQGSYTAFYIASAFLRNPAENILPSVPESRLPDLLTAHLFL